MRFTLLWVLCCTATLLGAERPADTPVRRTDRNSQIAHEQLLEKAKTGRIDIYFIGDSITRRWGTTDPQYRQLLENWKTNFFGWNAANFAWGGDRVENMLWRLENGELDGVNPKVIVILGGVNNFGGNSDEGTSANVARGIKKIITVCQEKASAATVVITAIFPRNDNMATVPLINLANQKISGFADGKKIRFLDINRKIAGEDGVFFDGMVSPDKLHPAIKTYQVWAEALKPIFTEILGPPGNEDFAPPPTGDPSAIKK